MTLEQMYEHISPMTEKLRAKYPTNIDGLEPALTNDIAEIVLEVLASLRQKIEGMRLFAETQPMATIEGNWQSALLERHVTGHNKAVDKVLSLPELTLKQDE